MDEKLAVRSLLLGQYSTALLGREQLVVADGPIIRRWTLDRIRELFCTEETFNETSGQTLKDFLKQVTDTKD